MIVLGAGMSASNTSLRSKSHRRSLRAPQAGCAARADSIACSTCAGVRAGEWWGHLGRSTQACLAPFAEPPKPLVSSRRADPEATAKGPLVGAFSLRQLHELSPLRHNGHLLPWHDHLLLMKSCLLWCPLCLRTCVSYLPGLYMPGRGPEFVSEGHPQTPGKGASPLCTPLFHQPASRPAVVSPGLPPPSAVFLLPRSNLPPLPPTVSQHRRSVAPQVRSHPCRPGSVFR